MATALSLPAGSVRCWSSLKMRRRGFPKKNLIKTEISSKNRKVQLHDMSTIRKAGALIFRDKRLLIVKPYKSECYINPGGKFKDNETPERCLQRELQEELEMQLLSFSFFKTYEISQAANTNLPLTLELYHVTASGPPQPSSEIETFAWLSQEDFVKRTYILAPSFYLFGPDLLKHSSFWGSP